jgi:sugar phosphate permease
MRGLNTTLIVTVAFVIFHFVFHWPWRQTLLVPAILLVFFSLLCLYEMVTGKQDRAE